MFTIVIFYLTQVLNYYERESRHEIDDEKKKEILGHSFYQIRINDEAATKIINEEQEYEKTVEAFASLGPIGAREMLRFYL